MSGVMILSLIFMLASSPVFADESIKTGSTVLFGSYEQDNNESNGAESIKWRVLSIDEENGNAFLLSTYILDIGLFNDKSGDICWENSYMRSWLNSYFLDTAFSEKEKAAIVSSEVKAESNPKYPDTSNGNDTVDSVFLLSYNEAVSLLHYAESGYMDFYKYNGEEAYINTDMISFYTPYAAAKGGYTQDFIKTGFWWCRTMGIDSGNVCNVANTGYASTYGHFITMKTYGIRPAIRVRLDSLTLTDDEVMPYYGKDDEDPDESSAAESSEEISEQVSEEPSEEESEEISEEISEEFPPEVSVETSESEASASDVSDEISEESPALSEEDTSSTSENSENSDDIFNSSEPVRNKMRYVGLVVVILAAILAVVLVRRVTNNGAKHN